MDKRASARRPASPGSQRAAPGTQRRDLRRDELTAAPAPTADPSFPKCYEPNTVYRDGQQAPPPNSQQAMIAQVMALTPQQIAALPPDQRAQIEMLREQFGAG